MKSVLFTIAAIALLASCNKQYKCNCTYEYPNAQYRGTQSILLESRQSDAENKCLQMSREAEMHGGSCKLSK